MKLMQMSNKKLALFLFRVVVGVNFFMHRAVRILGDYSGFASGLVSDF